jgi:hypothetical protein
MRGMTRTTQLEAQACRLRRANHEGKSKLLFGSIQWYWLLRDELNRDIGVELDVFGLK